MKKILTLLLFITHLSFSQTPSIEPTFFAADEEITITYNVTGTSLSGLDEAWIWMWQPGKSTDAPSNVNPASSNTSATNAAKFTRTVDESGQVFFAITLTPSAFFDQSAEEIESLGMLLKGNDWSNGQTEDFIATISNGFTLSVESPTGNFGFYESGQSITISAITSEPAQIDFYIDENIVESAIDVTSLSHLHTLLDDGHVHEISVTATNGTEIQETKHTYTLSPTTVEETLPAGVKNGINYLDNTSATLVLEAPNKDHVFVIGDFNNWSINTNYLMKRDGDKFWVTISGLEESVEYRYQYLVDGSIKIADPYAEKISSQFDDPQIVSEGRYPNLLPYPNDQTSEAASYLQTNQQAFVWDDFTKPEKEDLIIYELLIRDFTEERTYNAVTEKLDYLQDLGINAIELMPVMEFEGNLSWGYNPSSMFAVDKFYGTELDLKTLINEAHKRGMAVILDIVLNHQFGRNSLVRLYNDGLYGRPTAENPWFNTTARHDFNVGYDMDHESEYTKRYTKDVIEYWLKQYNVDGYRFDLSKGFTQKNTIGNVGLWGQLDANRVETWKRIADEVWAIDPSAYVILEHFADNAEEKVLANYGMMLWGNLNHTFRQVAKGNSTSLSWLYHEARGWNNPHAIGYIESHDEERVMWDLERDGTSLSKALDKAKLAAAFFLTVPGPKMIWQFGEMGYGEELNNDRLGIKPTHWEYLEDENRLKLFNLYKSLVNLRTKTQYIDSEFFEWSTSGFVKTINITHPEVEIYVVGNFANDSQTINHKFSKSGTWYDYFTGAPFEVSDTAEEVTLSSGRFAIYTSELIDNYIEDQAIILGTEEVIEISVFPNPTQGKFIIQSQQPTQISNITDLAGRSYSLPKQGEENLIDITHLTSGCYLIEFQINGKSVIKKIIKE